MAMEISSDKASQRSALVMRAAVRASNPCRRSDRSASWRFGARLVILYLGALRVRTCRGAAVNPPVFALPIPVIIGDVAARHIRGDAHQGFG